MESSESETQLLSAGRHINTKKEERVKLDYHDAYNEHARSSIQITEIDEGRKRIYKEGEERVPTPSLDNSSIADLSIYQKAAKINKNFFNQKREKMGVLENFALPEEEFTVMIKLPKNKLQNFDTIPS